MEYKDIASAGYGEILELHTDIYPLESILLSTYMFLDRAYFYLYRADAGKKSGVVAVAIKPREEGDGALMPEFLKELVRQALRLRTAKLEREVRKHIIGRALTSSLPPDSDAASEQPAAGR